MKKTLITTGIVIIAAFTLLYALNKLTSKRSPTEFYTKILKGQFEISVTSAGELTAEKSVDIKGPEIAMGRDIRFFNIKIQDLIPEGTVVKEGDYIATLDRTDLNNSLKDAQDLLTTLQTALNVKLLDTAVVLNELRDEIKNQRFTVQEAGMTLHNSKYEPLPTIRQAEIELDRARRSLEQQLRSYAQVLAQSKTDIINQNYWVNKVSRRVKDIEEVLTEFTIKAPTPGMVIYKREWSGTKRKVGSMINPFDRVVATLPDLTSMLSKTYVNEIDVSKMKTGQNVNITIDAFPKKRYNGIVTFIANVGEKLLNTNDKVFEVQIKIEGSDPELRPSMTTGNKIIVSTVKDAIYIPIECVQAGIDSIPYVYTKKGVRQIVLLGESNEKYVLIEKGLDEGSLLYLNNPENPGKFRLEGKELIQVIKKREKERNAVAGMYRKKSGGVL
ncbi:MAG: efflux RND transporter periplasmic adaptor subunit [Bacteroidales bacterium]